MPNHEVTAIVKRLRSQHHDLRQGAYYSPSEDPTWDATSEAADEIEALRAVVRRIVMHVQHADGEQAPFVVTSGNPYYLRDTREFDAVMRAAQNGSCGGEI